MIADIAKGRSMFPAGRIEISADELETMRLALLVLRDQFRDIVDECKAYGMKGDYRDQQIMDYHAEHAERAEHMARTLGHAMAHAETTRNEEQNDNV